MNAINAKFPHIEKGRIVGILGPNGSGKTTFIKLANGLLVPTEGKIFLDGKPAGQICLAGCSAVRKRGYL